LRARGVGVLGDITERTWGGIDTIIADADGNPIQVVQYLACAPTAPHSGSSDTPARGFFNGLAHYRNHPPRFSA